MTTKDEIMKKLIIFAAFGASSVFAAVPVIDADSISVKQNGMRTVVIEYTLSGASEGDAEPGIVTVDILTNAVGKAAVSVGSENLTTLFGDVNKVVAQGKRKILWSPTKEGMPEFTLPEGQVKAQITVWATNSPPAYWVLDLTKPADRSADRYYPDAEQIPLGVTNILYKTDRMVFRRIPATGVTWRMGNTETEPHRDCYHYVTFSYDYWMAIYEATCSQMKKLMPGESIDGTSLLPHRTNFATWRGHPIGNSEFNWPSNRHEKVDMHMKTIRTSLGGGIMVDLPTRSEWEFACRAGSSAKYCNGDTLADLEKVAWCKSTAGQKIHEVGMKEPNSWGLYDMHGNVAEWTLDKVTKYITSEPLWDPVGPMQDEADTGWEIKNRYMAACGGGQYATALNDEHWLSDKCTSASAVALQSAEGSCAARLTIVME